MARLKPTKVTESPELNLIQTDQNQTDQNQTDQNQIDQNQTDQNQTSSSNDVIDLSPDYDKLQDLKTEVIDNDNENKKKRGRKKKSETPPKEVLNEVIDFSILFDIIIKRLPNPQPLSDVEKSLINNSANKVYHKYSGELVYVDEINLGLVLLSITYPRLISNKI